MAACACSISRLLSKQQNCSLAVQIRQSCIRRLRLQARQLPEGAEQQNVRAQIFGKTMVCKDIEVASQVMKQAHIDCITIAGDQVLKSGKLCGGFLDAGRWLFAPLPRKGFSHFPEGVTSLRCYAVARLLILMSSGSVA